MNSYDRLKRRTFLTAVGLGIAAPLAHEMAALAVAAPGRRTTRLLALFVPRGSATNRRTLRRGFAQVATVYSIPLVSDSSTSTKSAGSVRKKMGNRLMHPGKRSTRRTIHSSRSMARKILLVSLLGNHASVAA
jgi:hypothetical protein